jgi:hypothetical protein
MFLEAKGMLLMLSEVVADHTKAVADSMKVETDDVSGEPYSFWAARIRQYIRAINNTFGAATSSTVTKELIDILRASVYSITDTRCCFQSPPANELEFHARVEAVLRCVFPGLRHKPPIGKPIKNFQPDTGLPALQTLIEYKFVETMADVKRVSDEVLADTRGYVDKAWDKFVFVIYETKRLKPESKWVEHLRSCGVDGNTQIIVISGEEPARKQSSKGKVVRANRLPASARVS